MDVEDILAGSASVFPARHLQVLYLSSSYSISNRQYALYNSVWNGLIVLFAPRTHRNCVLLRLVLLVLGLPVSQTFRTRDCLCFLLAKHY